MKIQQVRFDRKRVAAKRWTIPNIRDRVKALFAHPRARDINAILRNQLFVAGQINCRHGVLRSIAAPASGSRKNAERTRQQMPRPAYPALRKQLANLAAGDALPTQAHLGIIVDRKSHLSAQLAQQMNIARRLVPKVEVVTLMNFADMQPVLQNLMRKLMRGH